MLECIQSRAFEIKLAPTEQITGGREIPAGIGTKGWEDLFEEQQGIGRKDVLKWLLNMTYYFRDQMNIAALKHESLDCIPAWLTAVDRLCETQDALNLNVNQKLALTRCAVHLKRLMPSKEHVMA